MIKAVIIGFSHMHVNEIALYMSEQPDFELVGGAEKNTELPEIPPLRYTPKWNLENVKNNYCSNIYDDYKVMLDELKPDVAFVLSENRDKLEIARECAKRGVNIIIEKPAAMSCEEAEKIKAAAAEHGVEVYVNWPVVWREHIHRMKNAIDEGIIGTPLKLRYINGHTGPLGKGAKHRGVSQNAEEMTDEDRGKTWWHRQSHGGGIYLDISCYGCLFTKWLMGDGEKSAIAYGANLNTPFGDTDDNFAGIIKYDGKMSVLEGTWTTPRALIPSGPMVIGTEGVIMCTGSAEGTPDVEACDIYGNRLEVKPIRYPAGYGNILCNYAEHVKTGEPMYEMVSIEKNIAIMAMIDAISKSAKSGKEEKIVG